MLERLLGLVPVFLLDFHLRFHQHEDRIVPDAEILRERLLQEVVRGAHVPCIRVDHCGKHVCFNHRLIFVQAVIDLTQGTRRVIKEPAGLREEHLCLRQR